MSDPLLNLDTMITRPTIDIDGQRYEILSTEELSVIDSRRFGIWGRELQELQKGDDDSAELEQLIDTIARKALVGVPDEIYARLSGVQKVAVVEVFTGLLLRSRMSVAGAVGTAMGSPLIGEFFYPGFNDSTAARRGSGWRKRLSRWFGLSS